MVMIMVKFCAVSPSKNENRGLPLRKTGDCPDPDRLLCIARISGGELLIHMMKQHCWWEAMRVKDPDIVTLDMLIGP